MRRAYMSYVAWRLGFFIAVLFILMFFILFFVSSVKRGHLPWKP
jgi:hypothetical protein